MIARVVAAAHLAVHAGWLSLHAALPATNRSIRHRTPPGSRRRWWTRRRPIDRICRDYWRSVPKLRRFDLGGILRPCSAFALRERLPQL